MRGSLGKLKASRAFRAISLKKKKVVYSTKRKEREELDGKVL